MRAVAKAQEQIDVEEKLGDRATGASVELGFQVVEIALRTLRLGVGLGIGGDADLEIGDALEPGYEIGGVGIAAGMRRITLGAAWWIAAQGDDVPDPGLPIFLGHRVDLDAARSHTGQVRRRLERGLVADTPDRRVGALAGRPAGTIGD